MNQDQATIQKISFWNTVLIIFASVGGVIGLMDLPAMIDPAKQAAKAQAAMEQVTDPKLLATMEKSLAMMTSPVQMAYSVINLVLGLILLSFFVMAFKSLRQQERISSGPYLVHLGKVVVALLFSLLSGSATISFGLTLATVVLNLFWSIPAIMILKHLKTLSKSNQ